MAYPESKTCEGCNQEKPIGDFYLDGQRGALPVCADCYVSTSYPWHRPSPINALANWWNTREVT